MGLHNYTVKLIEVVAIAFFSCMDGGNNGSNHIHDEGNQTIAAKDKNHTRTEVIPKLKYFYNTDPCNGIVTERIPFPKEWQQYNSGEFAFTGPNDIKVYGENGIRRHRQILYRS